MQLSSYSTVDPLSDNLPPRFHQGAQINQFPRWQSNRQQKRLQRQERRPHRSSERKRPRRRRKKTEDRAPPTIKPSRVINRINKGQVIIAQRLVLEVSLSTDAEALTIMQMTLPERLPYIEEATLALSLWAEEKFGTLCETLSTPPDGPLSLFTDEHLTPENPEGDFPSVQRLITEAQNFIEQDTFDRLANQDSYLLNPLSYDAERGLGPQIPEPVDNGPLESESVSDDQPQSMDQEPEPGSS